MSGLYMVEYRNDMQSLPVSFTVRAGPAPFSLCKRCKVTQGTCTHDQEGQGHPRCASLHVAHVQRGRKESRDGMNLGYRLGLQPGLSGKCSQRCNDKCWSPMSWLYIGTASDGRHSDAMHQDTSNV